MHSNRVEQASTQAMAFKLTYLAHTLAFPVVTSRSHEAFIPIQPLLAAIYVYPFVHLRLRIRDQLLGNQHLTLTF